MVDLIVKRNFLSIVSTRCDNLYGIFAKKSVFAMPSAMRKHLKIKINERRTLKVEA